MKKMLALIFALCLFCVSVAAAETLTSDGTMVLLDDFALLMQKGMVYSKGEKTPNAILVQFQPYASLGDTASNINFVWAGAPYDTSVAGVNAEKAQRKQAMTEALESNGYSVSAFEYGDAFDCVIGDEPGVGLDSRITITYQSRTLVILQRQISMGTKGYVISISAADEETLDYMTDLVNYMVIWN